MVKHVVMWRFPEEEKEATCKKAQELLHGLKNKIDVLEFIEAGINENSSEFAYDLVLYTVFENYEAMESYRIHPEHQKVVEYIGPRAIERAVVDFEI